MQDRKLTRLWLNTPANITNTLGRLTRSFYHSSPSETQIRQFRAVIHGIRVILDAVRLTKELELEERVSELEELVKNAKPKNTTIKYQEIVE